MVYLMIVVVLIVLIGLPFILDYYIFFWGNYLLDLIGGILLISLGLNGIRMGIGSIRQRKNYKLQSLNRAKTNKKKSKDKQQTVKAILIGIICSILMIVLSSTFIKDFYIMSLDLSNVINNNYVKISCEVEKSTKSSSKGDHHSQYIVGRNLQDNSIIEINFTYKYDRILENKRYNIWYLPNSHMGLKAEPIN